MTLEISDYELLTPDEQNRLLAILSRAVGALQEGDATSKNTFSPVEPQDVELAHILLAAGLVERYPPDWPGCCVLATPAGARELFRLKRIGERQPGSTDGATGGDGAPEAVPEPKGTIRIYVSSQAVALDGQTASWASVPASFNALVEAAKAAKDGRWAPLDRNTARSIRGRLKRLHGVRFPEDVLVNQKGQGYRLAIDGEIKIVE